MRPFVILIAAWLATAALAQQVQWGSDAKAGVSKARSAGLPLLFYVTESSQQSDNDLEQARDRALRDRVVSELIRTRFVPVRLPRSTQTAPLVEKLGGPTGYGGYLLASTADGQQLGIISPQIAADPKTLAGELVAVFRTFRARLFDTELRRTLTDPQAKLPAVRKSLDTIKRLAIPEADTAVVGVLSTTHGSNPQIQKLVYDTLATLSTDPAVTKLLELAPTDKIAAGALEDITPLAAEALLNRVNFDDAVQTSLIYQTVAKVAKIKNRKNEKAWEALSIDAQKAEIASIQVEVTKAARNWQERVGQFR